MDKVTLRTKQKNKIIVFRGNGLLENVKRGLFIYNSSTYLENIHNICVPDPGNRDQDVVLVSAQGCWGNPRGVVGIWNRVGMGRG